MKKIILFVLFLNLSFSQSHSIEPDVFVQSTVNRAADTLGAGLTKDERMDDLKKIALETVDIIGIGFYSLGSHRKIATDKQKKEYEKYLKNIFYKVFQVD